MTSLIFFVGKLKYFFITSFILLYKLQLQPIREPIIIPFLLLLLYIFFVKFINNN